MQQQEQQHQHSSTLPPPSVPARPTALDGGSSRLTCASPSPIIATAGAGANGAEPAEFPFGAARAPSSTVTTPKTTSFVSSSRTLGVTTEQRQRHLDEQQQFGDKRETLVSALDSATTLVKGLAAFNQEKWTIHYPHQLGVTGPSTPRSTPVRSASVGPRPQSAPRSASMFAEEHSTDDEQSPHRPGPARSYSTVETPAKANTITSTTYNRADAPPPHPLSILSLDLKLGHAAATTASLPALLPSLSLATLSQLLSRRLTSAVAHIQSLRLRVTDKSSRILVTGDLNAGKSTFVNALLRRDLMPSDQQPCTTVFCEVLDAQGYNEGREEIHAIRDLNAYDAAKANTYEKYSLDDIAELQDPFTFEDKGVEPFALLKAYVNDKRAPPQEAIVNNDDVANPSFIRNGLVSISLIDAPGLNRDTLSTTALFARQSEIDVIVFVVSAENHFTLSAKEFLWNASREKAHVFIVVNKWNGIRDKRRCMRVVGEQIKQLSPKTWENRDELVHFVDAAEVVDEADEGAGQGADDAAVDDEFEVTAFDHLEQSLRSFVLLRRTTSKLAPAKHYLLNLLADLETLAATNVVAASSELERALQRLDVVKPVHERLVAQREQVEQGVDRVEETVVERVRDATWTRLERALDFVSEGKLVDPIAEDDANLTSPQRKSKRGAETPAEGGPVEPPTSLPEWQGVWNLWEWAGEVKKALVRALEAEVRAAEDEARAETCEGVNQVVDELGQKFLPVTNTVAGSSEQQQPAASSQQQERVFRPEVMFAKRRRGVGRLAARGVSTGLGLGTGGLGVSPSWTATDFDVSFFDLFDLERLYAHGNWLRGIKSSGGKSAAGGRSKKLLKAAEDDPIETSAILGLGIGSIGMLGSRVIGVKGTLDSISRLMEVLGSDKARRLAGPILGVLTVGLVAYVIVDLPRAVPRNIGRKLALALTASGVEDVTVSGSTSSTRRGQPATFSTAHAERISKETRKVLRLAGWDLRERFRAALDKSERERRDVEGTVAKSRAALDWLAEFERKVEQEESRVEQVEV